MILNCYGDSVESTINIYWQQINNTLNKVKEYINENDKTSV